jgi:hypothetical protein
VATDSDSQVPLFWERLRGLFQRSSSSPDTDGRPGGGAPSQKPLVIGVCLLISCILWLSFTLQEERTVTLSMPTLVSGIPGDQALAEQPPAAVHVQLRGEAVDLIRLYLDPPPVPLPADDEAVQLEDAITLSERYRVSVEDVNPERVRLQLEPRMEQTIPVRPRLRVQTPEAYELLQPPRVVPGSIQVAGAASVIEDLEAWPTDSLLITGLRDSVARPVGLIDTLDRIVTRGRDRVVVVAEAGRFAEATREIDVEVTGVPSDQNLVTLEPSTIRVRYRVLFDQLFESERATDFFATVSYDQIRSDTTGLVRPRLQLPADLEIRDPEMIPSRLRYYTFVSSE